MWCVTPRTTPMCSPRSTPNPVPRPGPQPMHTRYPRRPWASTHYYLLSQCVQSRPSTVQSEHDPPDTPFEQSEVKKRWDAWTNAAAASPAQTTFWRKFDSIEWDSVTHLSWSSFFSLMDLHPCLLPPDGSCWSHLINLSLGELMSLSQSCASTCNWPSPVLR